MLSLGSLSWYVNKEYVNFKGLKKIFLQLSKALKFS